MSLQNINIMSLLLQVSSSWLIENCHTESFGFPVLILKYVHLKNYFNFVHKWKIYSREVVVNETNRIINSVSSVVVISICIYETIFPTQYQRKLIVFI